MDNNQTAEQIAKIEERYYSGDQGRAKEELYSVLQNHPGSFHANLLLGKMLVCEEQGQHALVYLQKALQQKEDDAEAHANLGIALYQTGRYEACIKSYRRALELDPGRYETRQHLGQVMSQFVPPWHFGMLSDLERNDMYDQLLKEYVTSESVILDIGTGSGLLAMMAARHGAKHVYACEQSHFVAEVAKEIMAKNGYADRITLFSSKSSAVQPHHLPEAPNLIIGEIFDPALVGEGAVPSFRDALQRLGAPGCRIIPNLSEVKGGLIESNSQRSINPLTETSGFDLSAFDQFRAPADYASVRLASYNYRLLSAPQLLLRYDFEKLHEPRKDTEPIKVEMSFSASKKGTAHGVALWFDLYMEDRLILTNEPERLDNHWGQAICFFQETLMVNPGDEIYATLCHTDMRIWFEDSHVRQTH